MLSRSQSRLVDRLATERYSIPSILLMENAARGAADVAWDMLRHIPAPVLVCCGGGNNGGDGLAIARHLHNRGCLIDIAFSTDPHRYRGDALINFKIVEAMHLPMHRITDALEHQRPALLIDALFGTGLESPPREPFPQVATAINQLTCPVLAIDLPSGLDADQGTPLGPPSAPCIRATRTVTFVAAKSGFGNPASKAYTGEVTVADIGTPPELLEEVLREH